MGAAQAPRFLPGLTVSQAAAGRSALIAVIIAVAIGAVVLVPALLLLFGLFLRGWLGEGPIPGAAAPMLDVPVRTAAARKQPSPGLLGSFALAAVVVGVGVTVFADPSWATALGIVCMCAGAVTAFVLAVTLPDEEPAPEIESGKDRSAAFPPPP